MCLKCITRILFCIVIAIPKGMSGKYFLKVSSISDIAIMSKLQIKTLKFVYSSCCFTIPEFVLSDQLIAGTHNFRTNFFRPTKFRTNKFPDQLFFGFLTILTEKTWSDYRCFTVNCSTISSLWYLIGHFEIHVRC